MGRVGRRLLGAFVAHFAFLCPPFLGHINPMAAVASELVRRGDRVTFVHQPDVAALLPTETIGFRAVGAASRLAGDLKTITANVAGLNGLFGVRAVIRDVARTTDMLCREAPAALAALNVDALVCDQLEAAGGLIAGRMGLPFVSVANALLINREPEVPPPFTAWDYGTNAWSRERNCGGYRVSDWMMGEVGQVIQKWAQAWGLGDRRRIEDCLSPIQIGQLVPGLDFPRNALPPGFHYVGPLRLPDGAESKGAFAAQNGAPLVFASLGTLQGGRIKLFRHIAAACRDLGLTLMIAHGGRLSAEQVAALPGPPRAESYVPQRAVIRRAALVVTHGGLNTVLDALSLGVPLVVMPIAMEQGAIAARMRRAGAGKVVRRRFLTTAKLRQAMQTVLATPDYKTRAVALSREMREAGGAARAADIVQRALAEPTGYWMRLSQP